MPYATARTVSLHGALGHLIDVQADVSPGIVGTTLVGRPDASLNEAKDRCRMAICNTLLGSGAKLTWPATRRVTVLLAPSDLHKRGTHFDLAIACAVLAADDQVPGAALAGTVLIGELTLDGALRAATGVLPMVLAAAERGVHRVIVPEPQAAEAALVPGTSVLGMRSLAQVVAELRGEPVPAAPPVAAVSGSRLLTWRGEERMETLDLADLVGLDDACYAIEVAAAGGHHLLLSGPKGAGKTSIAERIPTILPPLSPEEALELTAVHSLAGTLDPERGLIVEAPYAAPHHDASKTALIGGGSGQVRPGELSRCHCGVLFLDEFPLFRTDVIDALRQPMENGEVTIARRDEMVRLPARGMVVLACNPCPCGEYRPTARENRCTCSEVRRRDYRAKISGPVEDRIDIVRHVEPVRRGPGRDPLAVSEPSAEVRRRVTEARERQRARFLGRSWRLNAHAPATALLDEWALEASAARHGRGRRPRRSPQQARGGAGAPTGLDGPRRGGSGVRGPVAGPTRPGGGAGRPATARRRPPAGRHALAECWMSAHETERLARATLSRVAEPWATVASSTSSSSTERRRWSRHCRPSATCADCAPTGPSVSRGATPHATSSAPPRWACGSWCPATTSGPPLSTTCATRRRSTTAAARRWACGRGGRPASTPWPRRWRSSGRAPRRRTGRRSRPTSAWPRSAPGSVWSRAPRSASTRRHTGVRCWVRVRRLPSWPAAPTGSTRRRTTSCAPRDRRRGRGGLRGRARAGADPDPVPGTQPPDRGVVPGHRGRRGGRTQPGAEHRHLGRAG